MRKLSTRPPIDVDQVADRERAGVVAAQRHRRARLPLVGLGVVDDVPVDRLLGGEGVSDGPTDAVHLAAEPNAGDGPARTRQRRDGAPGGCAALEVEGEAFVVRLAVLLDEAADGIEGVVEHRDADVIGALGQRQPNRSSDRRRDRRPGGRAGRRAARRSRRRGACGRRAPRPRPSRCAAAAAAPWLPSARGWRPSAPGCRTRAG